MKPKRPIDNKRTMPKFSDSFEQSSIVFDLAAYNSFPDEARAPVMDYERLAKVLSDITTRRSRNNCATLARAGFSTR